MTAMDYLHQRLQRDFGEKACDIEYEMDNRMEELLMEEPYTEDAPYPPDASFQFLLEEILYPFLSLRDAMQLVGVEDEIIERYSTRAWSEMPEEIQEEALEESVNISVVEEVAKQVESWSDFSE